MEISSFNIEAVEGKMLNYYVQSQQADRTYRSHKHKRDTETTDINVIELGKQAVKEHKDIHKLVASKMFGVKYEDVTDEQRRIAKTSNFRFMYKAGLYKEFSND